MKVKKITNRKSTVEAVAESKFNIISHIKMNAVVRQIRHLEYSVAIAVLREVPNRPARIVEKTIKSAYNNLLQIQNNTPEEECFIKEILVGTGPNIKRMRTRARGRADIIKKRTSHLTVKVARRA